MYDLSMYKMNSYDKIQGFGNQENFRIYINIIFWEQIIN